MLAFIKRKYKIKLEINHKEGTWCTIVYSSPAAIKVALAELPLRTMSHVMLSLVCKAESGSWAGTAAAPINKLAVLTEEKARLGPFDRF